MTVPNMGEGRKVLLQMTQAEALVLFEFIARFNEREDFEFEDQAEQQVLWNIECDLEKTLVEPLLPDYKVYLQKVRDAVRDRE